MRTKEAHKIRSAIKTIVAFITIISVIFSFNDKVVKGEPSASEPIKKGEPSVIEPAKKITKEEATTIVQDIFNNRNKAIIDCNMNLVKELYDMKTQYGTWAYEYEQKKDQYLHNWQEKQGVKFIEIVPKVVVKRVRGDEKKLSINFICSTEYKYSYENEPEVVNSSRIGTYHIMNLVKVGEKWIINKEWYKDPFGDSLDLEKLKVDSIKTHILSQQARDFSTLNERRKGAIDYALTYCGAASEEVHGFKYNKKYRDYNPEGGDCANFASQILHEGGKFKKNSAWGYDSSGATRAWLNADGFKNYMVGSGRASVIAYGSYERVYKASYKLLPGDFVAYEKKGDINHISVVTGADSKGYALVTCHNSDRNNVPWDLGWSDKKIKYWLVRVHY
ncbi:amidase domain-containing protein [Clostridium manihotivorum]|uniref:Amidase domain-containing protein n=1 Tax=Clostridium manihotivorum TaxID=2320868 RepID=A0A3R5QVK7_9CLOT|nr:amidase domain-containing protein [Clostridium manihotivorum]QAA30549.1 amidase domain-containing protein [Clostridium manihotivorum]